MLKKTISRSFTRVKKRPFPGPSQEIRPKGFEQIDLCVLWNTQASTKAISITAEGSGPCGASIHVAPFQLGTGSNSVYKIQELKVSRVAVKQRFFGIHNLTRDGTTKFTITSSAYQISKRDAGEPTYSTSQPQD